MTSVMLTSAEIRSRFLSFFEKRGHAIIPSASLVTPDEKGVINATLFNTAGMQPLIPYLLGKPHTEGVRLANVQKCIRTVDIDEIGDNTHATFFEMLGNWSLGDYFKKEAIQWSYEFLTNSIDAPEGDKGLGLDPKRLYVTVFEGDENAVRDDESAQIWQSVGIPSHRIYFKDASANWWPAVKKDKDDTWTGPTGPCSEMFYDITPEGLGDLSPEQFAQADNDQKIVEIWNDVFMEFEKVNGKIVATLAKKNVDTGAGFERLATVLQKKDNIYDTDLLKPVMDEIKRFSKNWNLKSARVVADHLKASIFLISDGVMPENTGRGYVLRRLIRGAIRHQHIIGMEIGNLHEIISKIVDVYMGVYSIESSKVTDILRQEGGKFTKLLHDGDVILTNLIMNAKSENRSISGKEAFDLFSSHGFPLEETVKIANSKNVEVDINGFNVEFKKHQSSPVLALNKSSKVALLMQMIRWLFVTILPRTFSIKLYTMFLGKMKVTKKAQISLLSVFVSILPAKN